MGYIAVEPAEQKATLTDLQWEWLAEKQRIDALTATRAAGEKWATAITTLTGVFSIVVLIKGPEDVTDVAGKIGPWLPGTVVDELWLAAAIVGVVVCIVLAIVGGIQKGGWIAAAFGAAALGCALLAVLVGKTGGSYVIEDGWWSLVFLLASIALVAVGAWVPLRPLRPPIWIAAAICLTLSAFALGQGVALWETVVVVALGAAVMLAGLSIIAGARAAYGPVYVAGAPSGGLLRTQQRIEVSRSRRWLLLAIYPAVCAVAFIALAIAVTWLKTPDQPAPGNLLIIKRTGGAVCGKLEGQDGTRLALRRAKTSKADDVPWTDVRALTVVASCPGE